MLAIFPQFLRPEYGAMWIQIATLWIIIALTQLGVYGGLALMADRVSDWMKGNPVGGTAAARCVGVVLMVAAVFTGFEGWRGW